MSLFANVLGFSLVGLAARFGQLSIQRRHPFSNPAGHLISMGALGFVGYWAYKWDIRAAELLKEKKDQLAARRRALVREGETALEEASA